MFISSAGLNIGVFGFVVMQVWCILLNDKVPFRIQWPQSSNLSINGTEDTTSAAGIHFWDDV